MTQQPFKARFGIDANGLPISNVGDPIVASDVATMNWITGKIAGGNGVSFPSSPLTGTLFYLTAISGQNNPGLYYYSGSSWTLVATGASVAAAASSSTSFSQGTVLSLAQTQLFYLSVVDGANVAGLYYQDIVNGYTLIAASGAASGVTGSSSAKTFFFN